MSEQVIPPSGRLRVLHLAPSFGVGGAEQMASHLMIGLSQSHEMAAASLSKAINSPIESRLREANIPLWHLGKRPGFDPKLFWSLDRVIATVRPHIVHTHMSVLRYALPGLLWRRVPVVIHTLHSLAEHETDTFGRMILRLAFRRNVLPVAVSQEVAASVKRVYGLECRAVVPNCIPVDRYCRGRADGARWREKERIDQDAILLTSVGRLEPPKNPFLLVRAFEALNDPRAHLVILGEGSLREQLTSYIRDHGLERRVHLLGARSEVPECLAASDVFVLSSNWEGNPLAVMEAMAAGLPVIATAVGGVPELVDSRRHGLLVPPGNQIEFTSAMKAMLDNANWRAAMASAARARALAAFNVDRMADGYARLYKAALVESPRRGSADETRTEREARRRNWQTYL